MSNWSLNELIKWNKVIEKLASDLGLDFYPQEFEICDYHDMLGYHSYVGMPSRYPHWSFGKQFEKQKTMYQHGLGGLSYEMVINTNPCLAYLMIDNPLSMQILTMAHVFGHNDFFKNNIHFSETRADLALEMFKRHANRVRSYVEDPGIGYQKVERILDAAHAISFQCDRNIFIRNIDKKEQKERYYQRINEKKDEWDHLRKEKQEAEPEFQPTPESDLLLFIRDNQPYLEEWEKDLLTIVRDETQYFLPQMETKIMNEGWASFWHFNILNRLDLPPQMHMDFIRSHNQVIRPHVGGINPYHIGFSIFQKLSGSDGHEMDNTIDPEIFNVRKIDRDSSFLRRFLTRELAIELHLLEYEAQNDKMVVSQLPDQEEGWEKIRETLISATGMNTIPVIRVKSGQDRGNELRLEHVFDGRELQMNYLEKTMEHLYTLWGNSVILETNLEGEEVTCELVDGEFSCTDR